jgi:hypothetical protein
MNSEIKNGKKAAKRLKKSKKQQPANSVALETYYDEFEEQYSGQN